MSEIFKELKYRLFKFIYSYEEIEIGELFKIANNSPCSIYNQEKDDELKFIENGHFNNKIYAESDNNKFLEVKKIFKTIR